MAVYKNISANDNFMCNVCYFIKAHYALFELSFMYSVNF